MTIRNRLKLIGAVPITLLMLLSGYFFVTSYTNFEKANSLMRVLNNNAKIDKLLNDLGKERGLTSLYLGTDQKEFKETLDKQRVKSDKAISSLELDSVSDSKAYLPFILQLVHRDNPSGTIDYQVLLQNLKKISSTRKMTDSPVPDFKKVFFDEYTSKYTEPALETLLKVNDFPLDTGITTLITSLSQLYITKENARLERGFVAYYMGKKLSMSFDEIALWDEFKAKANIFDLEQITDVPLRKTLRNVFNTPHATRILTKLAETSSAIQTDIETGDYSEDPMEWFALQTQKITLLSKAELLISNALWEKSEFYRKRQLLLLAIASTILLMSLILAYLGFATTRDITGNIQELEDVLNNAVEEMKSGKGHLSADTAAIENINLDTHEGTKEAYRFLETLVDTAKKDKQTALQSNEAKSLFLANMSHEIRTPLNGIVGFTEILRNTELTNEQEEFLSIIDKSSENLLSIINNILDLSKIESNKVEIENIIFDSREEFEHAVETYAVSAAEKNIDLNFYMDPTIPSKLKGDPTKIKEVIINLLSNAIKFTGYGGEVNVEIKNVESRSGTPGIMFSVQDNGIGMTKDQQARIFDAFSQADVSVTRKYGGTGLGLTISNQFVELMGGELNLESTKDKGTTFSFTTPLEEAASIEPNLANVYEEIVLGKYEEDTPTKLDTYMKKYFQYFDISVKYFESVGDLKDLNDKGECNSYWIDIDKANQNIIDALHNIDKSKLIAIASVTNRSKIEILELSQDHIIYKPVTLNKLGSALNAITGTTPEIIEQKQVSQETHFDAKVLVTEDNIINQKLIIRLLEEHGITTEIANNGLEAFEKRRSGDYDLIFMDIQMPVMDGIEATHEILDFEEDEGEAHIPIIALTANALKGDRERFLAEGIDEYITKPIETTELFYILNKFLSHKAVNKEEEEGRVETPLETATQTVVEQEPSTTEGNEIFMIEESEKEPFLLPEETVETEKSVLIAKQYLLERSLLAKVLDNLGYTYTILDDMNHLSEELASEKYDILFTDQDAVTDKIIGMGQDVVIVSTQKTKDEILNIMKENRG